MWITICISSDYFWKVNYFLKPMLLLTKIEAHSGIRLFFIIHRLLSWAASWCKFKPLTTLWPKLDFRLTLAHQMTSAYGDSPQKVFVNGQKPSKTYPASITFFTGWSYDVVDEIYGCCCEKCNMSHLVEQLLQKHVMKWSKNLFYWEMLSV